MLALVAACLVAAPPAEHPKAVLRNDAVGLAVHVHLPDPKAGFYRGTRFDWSGVIGPVEVAGRKVFNPWKAGHDPANHDDIVGPVEEFGMADPLGYADAKEGETFLKIGVGALVKPKEEKYRFYHNYPIKYPGEWQVSVGGREVEFRQELLARSGHGYRYTKKVVLGDTQPVITLAHELTNSGSKEIDTDVYNHNFFNVDAGGPPPTGGAVTTDPVGPNYALDFPFSATAPEPKERFRDVVALSGRTLRFNRVLDEGSVFAELKGHAGGVADHGVVIRHQPSGVVLSVAGSLPVEKYNLWAVKGCVCPEPFARIKLKPGETKKWTLTYTFQNHRYLR